MARGGQCPIRGLDAGPRTDGTGHLDESLVTPGTIHLLHQPHFPERSVASPRRPLEVRYTALIFR
jgi:hypothetical protein